MKLNGNQQLLISSLVILLSGLRLSAQENTPQRLDSLFRAVVSDPAMHFNGTVLVAENGKIIYRNAVGYADIDKKIMNGGATRFSLASLSKVFTAVAVMQLKENGKLKLDDPLGKFLPDFPYPAITIRQLLSHTSGLPDFMEIFPSNQAPGSNRPLTNQDIIPALKKWDKLVAPPGARWSYSSPGMALLALLVEKISGLSFPQYVSVYICKPAGLQHTYVNTPYSPVPDPSRALLYANPGASSAALTAADSVKTNFTDPIQTMIGPGLVVSSAEDLLRFDQALYGGNLLRSASQEEMFTPVKLSDGSLARLQRAPLYGGLGWGIDIDTSFGKVVSHTGGSPGIATILLRNLRTRLTVIVLENTDNRGPLAFGLNAMNILNRSRRVEGPNHQTL
ncbi:MAG TPA: serine hydrolase domain-containing protein [Puia sp.]